MLQHLLKYNLQLGYAQKDLFPPSLSDKGIIRGSSFPIVKYLPICSGHHFIFPFHSKLKPCLPKPKLLMGPSL